MVRAPDARTKDSGSVEGPTWYLTPLTPVLEIQHPLASIVTVYK